MEASIKLKLGEEGTGHISKIEKGRGRYFQSSGRLMDKGCGTKSECGGSEFSLSKVEK